MRLPGFPQGQRQIDERENIVDAMTLLLGSARRQDHRGFGLSQQPRGEVKLLLGNTGDALHASRPIRGRHAADQFKIPGARGDERVVHIAFLDGNVQEAVGERGVGPGGDLKMQSGSGGSGSGSRVGHDQRAATRFLLLKILHDGRHGLRQIAADQKNGVGLWDVRQRKRKTAVEAEGFDRCRCRRRHTKAAVVVDLRSPQRNSRELPQQVGFFVGEAAASEDPHAIFAVPLLSAFDGGGDPLQRFLPGCRAKRFATDCPAPEALADGRGSRAVQPRSIPFGTDHRDWWGNRAP